MAQVQHHSGIVLHFQLVQVWYGFKTLVLAVNGNLLQVGIIIADARAGTVVFAVSVPSRERAILV